MCNTYSVSVCICMIYLEVLYSKVGQALEISAVGSAWRVAVAGCWGRYEEISQWRVLTYPFVDALSHQIHNRMFYGYLPCFMVEKIFSNWRIASINTTTYQIISMFG